MAGIMCVMLGAAGSARVFEYVDLERLGASGDEAAEGGFYDEALQYDAQIREASACDRPGAWSAVFSCDVADLYGAKDLYEAATRAASERWSGAVLVQQNGGAAKIVPALVAGAPAPGSWNLLPDELQGATVYREVHQRVAGLSYEMTAQDGVLEVMSPRC